MNTKQKESYEDHKDSVTLQSNDAYKGKGFVWENIPEAVGLLELLEEVCPSQIEPAQSPAS